MYKKRILQYGMICILCMIFPVFTGCKEEPVLVLETEKESFFQTADSQKMTEESLIEESRTEEVSDSKQEEEIYVQVSGAVEKPGVYQLPKDSRIFQAVEMAGGTTPSADLDAINQAEILSDGQMVYVYQEGEKQRPVLKEEDGRIDLNTATKEQLMTLPGVGASKADSIISYRESCGGFQKIEEIMNIEGIKDGVFSKIKDRIKIS